MISSPSHPQRHTTVTRQHPQDEVATLAASNPRVDARVVREGLLLVAELRKAGVMGQGYDLASPYGSTVHGAGEKAWLGASSTDHS